MSRLFFSETGRVLYLENEELARRRHVRKCFHLPGRVSGGGTLFVFAKSRPGCAHPLRVRVNNRRSFTVVPDHHYYLSWFALRLEALDLVGGVNVVELWSDNEAMDGWILGVEPCVRKPDSALSLDGGRTWQAEHMGVHHCLRGEYVVRLRLDDPALCDPAPPVLVWERPDCEHFAALRAAIPRRVQSIVDPWRKARVLATWLSAQVTYAANRGFGYEHSEYCPWDPLTILAWRKANFGQYQSNPVAFCVHFGVLFVPMALALGIPARCVCGSGGTLERRGGHFVAEVWIERWRKWCYIDPMCDFVFLKDGVPLAMVETTARSAKALRACLSPGPGFYRLPVATQKAYAGAFGSGRCFRHWALWPRNDFLSHPERTPPSHGATHYVETDWLWAGTEVAEGMFPYHVAPDCLAAPPPRVWRGTGRI